MADLMNKVFSYKYIHKKDLKGFDKYKYSAVDTSPLSKYVMHPLWNMSVKFIPSSIAPNLITFVGFLCMVVDVVLLFLLDYDFTSSGKPSGYSGGNSNSMPDWILTLCGVLLFVAYNLDGIDGKQARKIGVSGPLGEMFDHGLDSYVVFFIPFCLISVFGRDEYSLPLFRALLAIMSVTLNFYVSHIEEYSTGTLYLPWGYDVSMWLSSIMLIVGGVYGPGFFKFNLFWNLSFIQAFEIIVHATGLLATLPIAIYNVYLHRKSSRKNLSLVEAIRPIWSMLVMNVLIVNWALASANSILEYDPRAFIFLYGTLFSNIACRLIVSEMCGQRCELVCWLNFPLAATVLVSLYIPQFEISLFYTIFFVALLSHIHYGICVVSQICDYFNVNCFTVPKTKRK